METTDYLDYPEEQQSKSLSEYISILKRHKGKMLLTGFLVFLTSLCLAIFLPPTYTSTATILIEKPIISNDLVDSTISSYAEQQVQRIRQRVLSRPNLRRIIDKFQLYRDQLDSQTWSKILKNMETAISVEMISADVLDPRSGRATKATIAFQVGFSNRSPETSQRVTNELVSLFLQENLKERTESAEEASSFFEREARKLRTRMEELDNKLFILKKERGDSLPEFQQQNNRLLERAYQRLEDINSQYNKAYERKIFLQSQLAQITPYSSSPGVVLDDRTRLKMLQIEYSNLLSRYSPMHPDVIKVKTEIESLGHAGDSANNRQTLKLVLKEKRAQLAKLKESYSTEHPDIISLVKEIQNIETQIASIPADATQNTASVDADNPAYIQTQAQLKSSELEILALEKSRKEQIKRINNYEQRLRVSPDVERQYNELMRNYNSTKLQYEQIQSKQISVNLAESVEKSRKGERYVMSEPPELPEEPTKPNRKAIVALGILLSAAAAIAVAALAESLDQGIYGSRQLAIASGEAPLSVIPYIEVSTRRIAKKKTRQRIFSVILVLILSVLSIGYYLLTKGISN
ncbi:MAG TPA: lipopolysaccharide biosynthesis protein [Crenotrichaceae bacterium]|nr:lipopolysaccharide biosynthesis protein [Crenotrichaceae bacterium]